LYLADVPGFMIGKRVERQGIIRAGAKMISAVSEATVPRISVVVRKACGAGLCAIANTGISVSRQPPPLLRASPPRSQPST
jgi:acetyl-CoA carboxylase carboxyltransferase component